MIGALAGAALGSNVAARNARPEGTVLGALVGAGVTAPAVERRLGQVRHARQLLHLRPRPSPIATPPTAHYAEASERCRLAPAPTEYNGRTETRYVRVCPDADSRYRVEG
ncbi:glycine zipper 2TM domain-containing protein [Caulobacter segnis]